MLSFRGREVLKSEGLLGLIELEGSERLSTMPAAAKRGLMKALVLVGYTCEDQASKDQYWNRVLKPLEDKFNGLLTRPDFKQIYNQDKVRVVIADLLEAFIGETFSCVLSGLVRRIMCSYFEALNMHLHVSI